MDKKEKKKIIKSLRYFIDVLDEDYPTRKRVDSLTRTTINEYIDKTQLALSKFKKIKP